MIPHIIDGLILIRLWTWCAFLGWVAMLGLVFKIAVLTYKYIEARKEEAYE